MLFNAIVGVSLRNRLFVLVAGVLVSLYGVFTLSRMPVRPRMYWKVLLVVFEWRQRKRVPQLSATRLPDRHLPSVH